MMTPLQLARKYLELPWVTRMDIAKTLELTEEGDDLGTNEFSVNLFRRARERGQITQLAELINAIDLPKN